MAKVRRPKVGEMVIIDWGDAQGNTRWTDPDTLDGEPSPCSSIGFVQIILPHAVTIVQTIGGDEVHNWLTIPWGWVVEVCVLAGAE